MSGDAGISPARLRLPGIGGQGVISSHPSQSRGRVGHPAIGNNVVTSPDSYEQKVTKAMQLVFVKSISALRAEFSSEKPPAPPAPTAPTTGAGGTEPRK
jgi:hypothetical protein